MNRYALTAAISPLHCDLSEQMDHWYSAACGNASFRKERLCKAQGYRYRYLCETQVVSLRNADLWNTIRDRVIFACPLPLRQTVQDQRKRPLAKALAPLGAGPSQKPWPLRGWKRGQPLVKNLGAENGSRSFPRTHQPHQPRYSPGPDK